MLMAQSADPGQNTGFVLAVYQYFQLLVDNTLISAAGSPHDLV